MAERVEETVIPLLEERLRAGKRLRRTGRVRVSVTTATVTGSVEEVLRRRAVDVERVPIGRTVEAPPPTREEGDTLVIPVVEEELVVQRRLVLREELRIRLRTEERTERVELPLRRQEVRIDRNEEETTHMRTITALFDSRPEAERAVEALVQRDGIDRDRIQVHAAGADNATAHTTERRDEAHHGFLTSLRDLYLPEEDHAVYAEGMRRGGILVSAQVPEDKVQVAMDSLEEHGAVDLDRRAQDWHGSGAGTVRTQDGRPVPPPGVTPVLTGAATRQPPDPRTGRIPGTEGSGVNATGATGGPGSPDALQQPRSATMPPEMHTAMGGRTGGFAGTPLGAGAPVQPAEPPGTGSRFDRAEEGLMRHQGNAPADRSNPAAPLHGHSAAGGTGSEAPTGLPPQRGRQQDTHTSGAHVTGREQVVPLSEERLRIGKRETSHGRVRVRSYVVEQPVEQPVRLHEEHVGVERRPADRAAPAGAFADRTVEATETAEEPVVSKDARVREEVVLRTEAGERTETVSDTVRRQQVDIERTRDPGA